MIYTVIYFNPNGDNEDEYLQITLEAKDEEQAKDLAMHKEIFREKINMVYFGSEHFRILKLRNHKIGEFFHYKGKDND